MPPQVLIQHLISLWKTSLKIRNFSDVHESYLLHGGKGSRKAVLAKLQKHFNAKLIAFTAPGLSSLLMLGDTDQSVFKVLEDDDDGMIQNISKAIFKECKHLVHNKHEYTIRVDKQTGINSVSATPYVPVR